MDCENVRSIVPNAVEAVSDNFSDSRDSALSERYAARGLHRSVLAEAAKQIEREEETRALAPDAYRLSRMPEGTVRTCYRRGKDQMSSSDLVHYIAQTRARRIRGVDFSAEPESDEPEEETSAVAVAVEAAQPENRAKHLTERMLELPRRATKHLAERLPVWFNNAAPDTTHETHRFPISAFAAILAVAMSLMLIVASSVLITRAESGISALRGELDLLADEVEELEADFAVTHNMLEIYRIATEEYGMVSEEYVKMHELSNGREDSVEIFEDEREQTVGLAAILSAIGIK